MLHQSTDLTFYLIRHGQALRPPPSDRVTPAGLTELGRAQVQALGRRLNHEGIRFDHFYSSTLTRAVQTAELLAAEIEPSARFEMVEDLVEWREGDWEGLPRDQLYTPERLAYMRAKSYLFVPPGGESLRMVQRRVSAWLEDTILYNKSFLEGRRRILIVCHGLVIRTLLQYVLGFYPNLIKRLAGRNAAITEIRFDHEGWSLERFNDAAHLFGIEGS